MAPRPCPAGVTTETTLGPVRLTITGIRPKASEPPDGATTVVGVVTVVVVDLELESSLLWQPAATRTASRSAQLRRTGQRYAESASMVRAMVEEARLEAVDSGLAPVSDGWFVVNPRDAWRRGIPRAPRSATAGSSSRRGTLRAYAAMPSELSAFSKATSRCFAAVR